MMAAEHGQMPPDVGAFDVDMCLGFQVFAAELELLATNNVAGNQPEELYQLLQKLQGSIPRAEKCHIKEHHRMVETILLDEILMKGACSTVRKLIGSVVAKLYAAGDTVAMYQRVNNLMNFVSKEATSARVDERIRLGAIEVLAHLFSQHGRILTVNAQEAVSIAAKAAGRSSTDVSVRVALLRLVAAVVAGTNPNDRNAVATQTDAWKLFDRFCRDRASEQVCSLLVS